MTRRVGMALAVIVLVAGGASQARAGFILKFDNTMANGTNTAFHYLLDFDTSGGPFRLETGSNMLSPGTVGSQDFATLYDIPGFVSASLSGSAALNFSLQTQDLGINDPRTVPPDSPALTNVTVRYTGGVTSDSAIFGTLSVISTFPFSKSGFYTSQYTNTEPQSGSKVGQVGRVTVPDFGVVAVPEPSTFALGGTAGVVGLCFSRRRKRTAD